MFPFITFLFCRMFCRRGLDKYALSKMLRNVVNANSSRSLSKFDHYWTALSQPQATEKDEVPNIAVRVSWFLSLFRTIECKENLSKCVKMMRSPCAWSYQVCFKLQSYGCVRVLFFKYHVSRRSTEKKRRKGRSISTTGTPETQNFSTSRAGSMAGRQMKPGFVLTFTTGRD